MQTRGSGGEMEESSSTNWDQAMVKMWLYYLEFLQFLTGDKNNTTNAWAKILTTLANKKRGQGKLCIDYVTVPELSVVVDLENPYRILTFCKNYENTASPE